MLAASAPGAALADVVISPDNFPDPSFRVKVGEYDNNPKNGVLSDGEIAAVTRISCGYGFGAKNLVGIKYFTYC